MSRWEKLAQLKWVRAINLAAQNLCPKRAEVRLSHSCFAICSLRDMFRYTDVARALGVCNNQNMLLLLLQFQGLSTLQAARLLVRDEISCLKGIGACTRGKFSM